MSVLARCCPMLHTVYLGGCELITDLAILATAQGCPMLKILCTIDARQLTKASLIALGIGCPLLEEVSFPIKARFEDAVLHHFFTECPNLRIVDYGGNCYFKQLASGCPNLQYASIYNDDQCAQMGEESHRLEVVEIGHHYETVCEATDVGIQALARGSPLLADIRIWQSKTVTDEGICVLAQCSSLLHAIDLSGCKLVTDVSILAIAMNCLLLTTVCLGNCSVTADGVNNLVKHCPCLRYLDFTQSSLSVSEIHSTPKLHTKKGTVVNDESNENPFDPGLFYNSD